MRIKRRERDSILQSLQAGLVPRQGLHLIQVGRKAETEALLQDISRIRDDGSSFRLVVGRFGSGKSFFLNLIRHVALQQNLVTIQGDFTMERRLHASGGEARALYSELMRNMATRAKPEGGSLASVCTKWISGLQQEVMEAGGNTAAVEARISSDLADLQEHVGGFEFAEVLRIFYRGTVSGDETQKASALRWLRGEYPTKTEARQALGVRRIIDDDTFYDSLKLMAAFCRKAGYDGMLVLFDELVVLSHRLPSSRSRVANFEAILTILNDSVQGSAKGIGFIFAGTDESLEDKRRGLFSYEALRSRLAENRLAAEGLVDLSGPVVRLQALSPEDLFVLLRNISIVHANGDVTKRLVPDEGIAALLNKANETLGAEFFKTPRDVIRSFVGLLNLIEQNPGKTWSDILGLDGIIEKPTTTMSTEEEIANESAASSGEEDGDLASFTL
ncbi:ATP-binding protein [Luteolibacter sp. AS25]|uniref:ATP-binding protein n=1 Tax=Luteolibacter sp. AS25 TaxID=3135776 RepID=UPI00398B2B49